MYFASNLLCKQIKKCGYDAQIVHKIDPKCTDYIWIIYNNSLSWAVPKYYISYQTEQIGSHWFNQRYYQRLASSLAVWEYNEANLPCYHHLNDNIHIVGTGIEIQPKVKKDIDFVFYGGLSQRRKDALKQLKNVHVITDKLGQPMQSILARTKTVINIHYYDKSPLETFRINEALSHGCNVISEHSISGDEDYKDVVKFCTISEMKNNLFAFSDIPKALNKFDNLEQVRTALKSLELSLKNAPLDKKTLHLPITKNENMAINNFKISKYELKQGLKAITFRPSPTAAPVTINNDNITDALVELAKGAGKGHCFVELLTDKKKEYQLNSLSQRVTLTSTEQQIEKEVLEQVQEIKSDVLSEVKTQPKKKGRPANSKE